MQQNMGGDPPADAGGPVNVVCIKWGTAYSPDYVNRLYGMVARNLSRPFRFVCFTDDARGIIPAVECAPIPPLNEPAAGPGGGWRKLSLLAPQLLDLKGMALFLDLDVLITGSLDCFFDLPGQLCIIENWTQRGKGIGNSSVFRFDVGSLADAYRRFNDNPDEAARPYSNEQAYLSLTPKSVTMRFWPDRWVRSFKVHCVRFAPLRPFLAPHIPHDARIIAFHGFPKMDEAAAGKKLWEPSKHPKSTMPWFWRKAPWIDDIWMRA